MNFNTVTFEKKEDIVTKGNLEITTKIGCSNICEYCPQVKLISEYKKQKKKHARSDKLMSVENFKKYISTIPTEIDFHFTGYVEPFDNPDCDELLMISHKKGHKVQINTTLEGLTKEKFDRVKNLPFKTFIIHMPSGTYYERIGRKLPMVKDKNSFDILREDWLEMLEYVIRNKPINFKVLSHGGAHPKAVEVLQKLANEGVLQQEHVSNLNISTSTRSQNKAQDNKEIVRQKIPPQFNIRGKCSRIYQSVLLPNGRMGLCCQDYGLEHVVGDLSKQTWKEYRTTEYFRKIAIEGENLCDYCDMGYHTYGNK